MWAQSEQSQLEANRLKNATAVNVKVTDMDIKKTTLQKSLIDGSMTGTLEHHL